MQENIKICRILKLRDDEDIIKENLIYYYNIGVKDTFIMLHFPSEELIKKIEEVQILFPDNNIRLLYHNKEGKGFNPVNEDYLRVLTNKAQSEGFCWIIGSDADEFLILKKHEKIQDFIKEYNHYEIISLLFKWVNFYCLKEEKNSPFYEIMQYRNINFLPWTKSIGKFNKKMYFVQGLHHIGNMMYGQCNKKLKKEYIDSEIAYYAHFPYRSKEQFIKKNKNQALKFNDWRMKKINKDPDFFSKYWDELFKQKKWPNNLDKNDGEFNKKFIFDPIDGKLFKGI